MHVDAQIEEPKNKNKKNLSLILRTLMSMRANKEISIKAFCRREKNSNQMKSRSIMSKLNFIPSMLRKSIISFFYSSFARSQYQLSEQYNGRSKRVITWNNTEYQVGLYSFVNNRNQNSHNVQDDMSKCLDNTCCHFPIVRNGFATNAHNSVCLFRLI